MDFRRCEEGSVGQGGMRQRNPTVLPVGFHIFFEFCHVSSAHPTSISFNLSLAILQRKLEREFVLYGGAPPSADSTAEGSDQYNEIEDGEQVPSLSGTFLNSQFTVSKIYS